MLAFKGENYVILLLIIHPIYENIHNIDEIRSSKKPPKPSIIGLTFDAIQKFNLIKPFGRGKKYTP